jgi:hypothetical protein
LRRLARPIEQAVREILDLGRPEEIELIFYRRIPCWRQTPERFCTRIITAGVSPR